MHCTPTWQVASVYYYLDQTGKVKKEKKERKTREKNNAVFFKKTINNWFQRLTEARLGLSV